MTNNQIIASAAQELAENGIINYTGRTFKITLKDGSVEEYKETEPIHTYQAWKSKGYQVKRGEKSIATIRIWKFTSKPGTIKAKNDKGEDVEVEANDDKMFMKDAFFFKTSQVEKIEK